MHFEGAGDEDGEAAPVSIKGECAKTAVQAGDTSAEDRAKSSSVLTAELEQVGRPIADDSYKQSANDDLPSRASNLCVHADTPTGPKTGRRKKRKKKKVDLSDRGDGRGAADHNHKAGIPPFNIQQEFLNPESLQEKVESALESIRTNATRLHVKGLASSLREIIINFSQQLSHSRGNQTKWEAAQQLPKGLPLLLESLALFLSVLDMSPPPILWKGKEREQGAGLHRIALVELLNLLLVPESPYIEERLTAEETPARLISLIFQFPWNSILQGAIFRSLQAMLSKPNLRNCVLGGTAELASILPKVGEECVALPMEKRPGYSGFILRLSERVRFIAEHDPKVQDLLAHNKKWTSYAGPGGALERLLGEHAGQL